MRQRALASREMHVAHVANHRVKLRQLLHALEVRAELRFAPIGFDVMQAAPLPVVKGSKDSQPEFFSARPNPSAIQKRLICEGGAAEFRLPPASVPLIRHQE